MKLMLAALALVLGVALQEGTSSASTMCFSQICDDPNTIRGQDTLCGSGAWNAPRGNRKHKGIDIVCSSGTTVQAPFDATVLRAAQPYANSNKAYNTGIYLSGTGNWKDFKVKIFYVKMNVASGTQVSGGTGIGTCMDIAQSCSDMTNHVHVKLYENGKVIDPTSYVC